MSAELRKGYKQTEAGVIPEDWEVNFLSNLTTTYSGGTPSTARSDFYGGEIPWITSGDLNQNEIQQVSGRITPLGLKSSAARMVDKDTPLIALYGATAGVVSISRIEASINQAVLAIVPTGADGLFLVNWLRHSKDKLLSTYVQGGQPNLSGAIVRRFVLPLPPLPEQRAIASALADVDALLASLEALLTKKRQLKQAAMQELLTGKARLDGFGGEWETISVGELASRKWVYLSRGKVISKIDINRAPGSYPIYSSSVKNNGLFGNYGEYMFDEDLISWSVDGGGDFFFRPKHKFSLTNVCGYMRVEKSEIDTLFLTYQLQMLHSSKIFDYQIKSHPSVVKKEYVVELPSLTEQKAIVSILSEMDAELDALAERVTKTRQLKQGMMQELLTGRTRLV